MNITIRELGKTGEFYDTLKVQEAVGFTSVYGTVAPHLLKALAMKEPLMGIVLGAYLRDKMIGYLYDLPTSSAQEHYMHGIHVMPKYHGYGIGKKMMTKMGEIALKRGVVAIYWTYDPLEGKNANLYLRKCGAQAIKHYKDYYKDVQGGFSDEVSNDRFMVKWDLKQVRRKKPSTQLDNLKTATSNFMPGDKEILVEIPWDFNKLMKNDVKRASKWRLETRKVFEKYINEKGYKATNFLQCKRRNFYLLTTD